MTEAEPLARGMMTGHGLDGWAFKFDRSTVRTGYCDYLTRTIQLGKPYVLAATEEEVQQSVLHEVAHALVGQHVRGRFGRPEFSGHGREWAMKAKVIGYTGGVTRPSTHHENEQAAAVEQAMAVAAGVAHVVDGPLSVGERVRKVNGVYRGLLVSVAWVNGQFLNDADEQLFHVRLEYLRRETS